MLKRTERAVPGAWRLPLLLSALGAALGAALAEPAGAQPCQEKQWIDHPVMARSLAQGSEGIGGTGRGPGGSGKGSGSGDGIGGTGRGEGSEGIGGTGHSEGIGGTGRSADEAARLAAAETETAFIGVIAGFASICVNGQEIHFGPASIIRIDGKNSDATHLDLGQMVAVDAIASSTQAGEYYARRIEIFNTLRGPVEQIDAAQGRLRVLGQTLLAGEHGIGGIGLADFALGESVIANGSRLPNGDLLLTRLERAPNDGEVSLLGPVTQLAGDTFKIHETTIHASPALAATLRLGQEVLVRGREGAGAGRIEADSVIRDPQLQFGDTVRRLDLQGHIRRLDGRQRINVGGAEIELGATKLDAAELSALSAGLRVKVAASIGADGRIVAEGIRIARPAGRTDSQPPPPPGGPEHNPPRKGNERDGVENGPPPPRADLPLPLVFPARPNRPDSAARGAEIERPRADVLRPDLMRRTIPERLAPR